MAVIKNFLYNGLAYRVDTGFVPIVVNNQTVRSKVKVPKVSWALDFGLVKNDLHNHIEALLFGNINDLYLATHTFPNLKLFKVTGGAEDFYTYRYLHEEVYYGIDYYDVTNRKMLFTTDGTYDTITDGDLIITIADIGTISLENKRFPHFVHYLDNSLRVKHEVNKVFRVNASVVEYFDPTVVGDIAGTVTYVGASNASDSGLL